MSDRASRGFTLIELGVVVAVIAVLASGAVWVGRGFQDAARARRTASEMTSLTRAATGVAGRGVSSQLAFSCSSGICSVTDSIKTFDGVDLLAGSVCYDLSCTVSGSCWGGGAVRVPTTTLATALAGPTTLTGRSGYAEPYALCVFRRRVLIATCVPDEAVLGELSGATAGACPSGFDCAAGRRCIAAQTVLLPPNLSRLAMSYRYLYAGGNTTAP